MLPAVRSLIALPEPAKQRMAEFLELVPGVPLTADVKKAAGRRAALRGNAPMARAPYEAKPERSHGRRQSNLHERD